MTDSIGVDYIAQRTSVIRHTLCYLCRQRRDGHYHSVVHRTILPILPAFDRRKYSRHQIVRRLLLFGP